MYHQHLFNTHGNNNLLIDYSFPYYTAQGEQKFIDDIYDNLDELDNGDNINTLTDNRMDRVQEEENIQKQIEEEPVNKSINGREEFKQLKQLFDKQVEERSLDKMLFFVTIVGICIILLINNKSYLS